MPKTIWILNQTAGTLDSGWGERHVYLSKKWVAKGYDVKIISGSYNHLFTKQPKTSGSFTLEEVAKGITFCWVKVPNYKGGGFSKFWSNLIYTLRVFFLKTKNLGKPNVILLSSMPIFPIISAVYLKRKYKAEKLITEIRDLWPLTPIHLKGYPTKHPLIVILTWFEKYAYRKSDAIVSLLPNAKQYITAISKDASKFSYIPNGIDSSLIESFPISEENRAKIPQNKFIIGYTGTIGMANSMEFYIEAARLLKDDSSIHFVLVGDGYLKEKLIEASKDLKNITFIDKIKKHQIQNMISYFDVCYVGRYDSPLYNHGVSYNKYFDYMLAKKPILESSNYIKDPVELSGCGLIVPPESAKAIVEGILKLKAMPLVERESLGKLGYDYVKKYHNFEYLSNKFLKIF